jgi:hypothetical protein
MPVAYEHLSERLDHFNLNMSDDVYWSESSWFSWAIPERSINGFFYSHFRPNMNCMLAGPAMWDPSGYHAWEFLYFDWQQLRRLPEGRYGVEYDFRAPWGLSIQMLDPVSRYHLQYERNAFKLDLVFEAIAEPLVGAAKPGAPGYGAARYPLMDRSGDMARVGWAAVTRY